MTGQDALHSGNGISESFRADFLADKSRLSGWSRWCANPINKVCGMIVALPVPSWALYRRSKPDDKTSEHLLVVIQVAPSVASNQVK